MGVSIPVTITVTSDKGIEDLTVSLTTDFGGMIVEMPEKSDVIWKDANKHGIGWKKKVQGGQTLEITQNVCVDHPAYVYFYARAKVGQSADMVNIYENHMVLHITETGGTMYLENTPMPRPSGIPVIATHTPGPSVTFMITSTPWPSPTLGPDGTPPTRTSIPIETALSYP